MKEERGTKRSPVKEAAQPRTMNGPDLGPHAPVMGCRHDIPINRENPKSLSYLHIPLLPHGGGRAGEELECGDSQAIPAAQGHAYGAPHSIVVTEWGGQRGNFLKSRDDRMFDLMCHGKWEDSEAHAV